MDQKQIDRINELAQKAKSPEGLTEEERVERSVLRRAYSASILGDLESQLERMYLVDEEGNPEKLKKRED